jgi:aminoglycoside 3-N-acetyltransferase
MNATNPIRAALAKLEVLGAPLLIHSSIRSLADDRRDAVEIIIDTCLATRTTLMVPSWTEHLFEIDRPSDASLQQVSRTGTLTNVYRTESRLIDGNMGSFARSIVERSDRVRGVHPLNSFAAVGPDAEAIIRDQTYTDVYSPIVKLAELGGNILLIGVGLNRMTAFHLAEQNAGRQLFARWALDPAGAPRVALTGGCSEGFPRLWPAVSSIASELDVNGSHWISFPAHDVIRAASHAINTGAIDTTCSPTCRRCPATAASGSIPHEVIGILN